MYYPRNGQSSVEDQTDRTVTVTCRCLPPAILVVSLLRRSRQCRPPAQSSSGRLRPVTRGLPSSITGHRENPSRNTVLSSTRLISTQHPTIPRLLSPPGMPHPHRRLGSRRPSRRILYRPPRRRRSKCVMHFRNHRQGTGSQVFRRTLSESITARIRLFQITLISVQSRPRLFIAMVLPPPLSLQLGPLVPTPRT